MNMEDHSEHLLDRTAMLAMRALLAVKPASRLVPASRSEFDALMEKTPTADGITYEAASMGGVDGWWCRPAKCPQEAAVIHLHGGAYVLGSATAYRNFCGQIAARCGLAVFIADYALAPERLFPHAFTDAEAVAQALIAKGISQLVVAGDSAGGGLALALLQSLAASAKENGTTVPKAGIVFSPWADLALTGDSLTTRASEDPLLTRESLNEAACDTCTTTIAVTHELLRSMETSTASHHSSSMWAKMRFCSTMRAASPSVWS